MKNNWFMFAAPPKMWGQGIPPKRNSLPTIPVTDPKASLQSSRISFHNANTLKTDHNFHLLLQKT